MAETKKRCCLLDTIRGFTVINMVLFHASWDLVYMFGVRWDWYHGQGAYFWQQCICCTFITLSGFCAGMGKHTLRRGAVVFGLGAAVTLVTLLFMPENLVLYGVLTLIGSCMMLTGLLKKPLMKIPAVPGFVLSLLLFGFTRHVSGRFLGIWTHPLIALPEVLYRNHLTAYFGFPQPDFYSTDYFPLFPWMFLFLTGFFAFRLFGEHILRISWKGIPGLNFIGRHALEIYVVHQPVIAGLLFVWDRCIRSFF